MAGGEGGERGQEVGGDERASVSACGCELLSLLFVSQGQGEDGGGWVAGVEL